MNTLYTPFQPTLTSPATKIFGLHVKVQRPCLLLRDCVHCYLQITTDKPSPYPVMPDGTQAVYISTEGIMIGGAQLQALDIPLMQAGEYFGIWFYPGALRHFFSLKLSEISDQFVDEQYFPCQRFLYLHQEIYKSSHFFKRAAVCEQWLLSHLSKQSKNGFDKALSLIYQSKGSERISHLARSVGYSSRHLNRQFLQHTGLGTKTFSQVIRAQHVCRQLYPQAATGTPLSVDGGFYDQAHLITDFKKHFSASPGAFFKRFISESNDQDSSPIQ